MCHNLHRSTQHHQCIIIHIDFNLVSSFFFFFFIKTSNYGNTEYSANYAYPPAPEYTQTYNSPPPAVAPNNAIPSSAPQVKYK